MLRSELVGDTWVLPRERTKNKREHAVPMPRQAMEIIAELPDVGDKVFGLRAISLIKRALDEAMKPDKPWRLHDLRRTVASGMARLGVALPVVEKCLNHAGGSFSGIVAVYQHHTYDAEKRIALQRWADHVAQLVTGKPAKVIPLRGRRR
jgi:integrase